MNLYKLNPIDCNHPAWNKYGVLQSIVVRARDELQAREIAQHECSNESSLHTTSANYNVWLNPLITICILIGVSDIDIAEHICINFAGD